MTNKNKNMSYTIDTALDMLIEDKKKKAVEQAIKNQPKQSNAGFIILFLLTVVIMFSAGKINPAVDEKNPENSSGHLVIKYIPGAVKPEPEKDKTITELSTKTEVTVKGKIQDKNGNTQDINASQESLDAYKSDAKDKKVTDAELKELIQKGLALQNKDMSPQKKGIFQPKNPNAQIVLLK